MANVGNKFYGNVFVDDIDFKRCWELSNLQPLWANENRIKRCKLKKPFQPSLSLSAR